MAESPFTDHLLNGTIGRRNQSDIHDSRLPFAASAHFPPLDEPEEFGLHPCGLLHESPHIRRIGWSRQRALLDGW